MGLRYSFAEFKIIEMAAQKIALVTGGSRGLGKDRAIGLAPKIYLTTGGRIINISSKGTGANVVTPGPIEQILIMQLSVITHK